MTNISAYIATTLLLLTMAIMIYSRNVSKIQHLYDGDDEMNDYADFQHVSLMNAVSFENLHPDPAKI